MRFYMYFLAPLLLFLSSCSTIRYVNTDKDGNLVTDTGKPVHIFGNPPIVCHYENSPQYFSGYFMYRKEDGTFVIDDFGRGTIELMNNPTCELKPGIGY